MQAIITKYLSPTNVRGSRIKATCWQGSITIPYPHDVAGQEERHQKAAEALIDKLKVQEKLFGHFTVVAGGVLPDSTGYAFII